MIRNGKLFGKINIFDFAVVLLLVLLILGVCFKFFVLNPTTEANTVEVTYEIQIESVRDVTVNAFTVGERVNQYTYDENIGTITAIDATQAMDLMETLEGNIVEAPLEDRFDLTLSVKGSAIRQDDGNLMMGKVKLVEGSDIRISTRLANCIGIIRNVQWK